MPCRCYDTVWQAGRPCFFRYCCPCRLLSGCVTQLRSLLNCCLSLSLSLSRISSSDVEIVRGVQSRGRRHSIPRPTDSWGEDKEGPLGICMDVLHQVISQFVSQLTLTSLSGVMFVSLGRKVGCGMCRTSFGGDIVNVGDSTKTVANIRLFPFIISASFAARTKETTWRRALTVVG